MNPFDRFVGGGIADLMAQYGNQPSALDFVQQNEPIIRMARGGMPEDYFDETLNEDFGFTPYQNNQAAVQAAPAPVFQAPAAPTPPAGVSPTPGVQFTPERNLPFQQVQSTAAPAGIASLAPTPTPIQASVPAYTPPASTLAPSPFGMSFDQTAGDELGPVTGADLGISAPAAPAASPAAQAPATAPAPSPVQQGYSAYGGELHPSLAKSKFTFDTQQARDQAAYEAQYGGNQESGTGGGSGVNPGRPIMEQAVVGYDENGYPIMGDSNTLDKRYGLTDTSGLVHGTQQVKIDPKHYQVTRAFFDPKTGQMVGQPVVGTFEIPKTNWIENLVTNALFALPSIAIPGFGLGASLMSGAKAASEGNVLGALTGLAGGVGAIPGAEIPGMDTLKTVGNAAKTVGALTSGDPLQILGAAANLSGSEDLATASKVANTAALAKAAISGDPNAILKLATTYGSDVGDVIKGAVGAGAGDMTGGEADERKGASDTYNTLANLPDNKATANAIDTILKGENTSVGTGTDLTSGISDEDLDTLLGVSGAGADTGEGIEGADLTEGEGEERKGVADVNDLLSSLGYTSTAGEDEDRAAVANVLADLGDYGLTDREAEDRAAVKDIIDTFGYTPGTTAGGGGGTGGGTTTKTTTPTDVTTAKSSFDPRLLMALSALASGRQQTEKERVNAAKIATKSPFGTLPYSDIVDAYEQIYGA